MTAFAKKRWIHKTVSRDVSCEITTHTSLAAAIVVAPQLDGVVVDRSFLSSALLGVLPLQLLGRPLPLRLDDIALPGGLVIRHGRRVGPLPQWAAHCKRIQACDRLLVHVTLADPHKAGSSDVSWQLSQGWRRLSSTEPEPSQPPRGPDVSACDSPCALPVQGGVTLGQARLASASCVPCGSMRAVRGSPFFL